MTYLIPHFISLSLSCLHCLSREYITSRERECKREREREKEREIEKERDDDDCFYYHPWRNNVVIEFGTLSSFLT